MTKKGGLFMLHNLTAVAKEFKPVITSWMDDFGKQLSSSNQEDEEVVRRANFIVRNKALQVDDYFPQYGKLYFTVQDTSLANVELNFIKGTMSCTCATAPPCRHVIASVMWLYQYYNSLQKWITNWRAQKLVQMQLLSDERTPASWRHLTKSVLSQAIPAVIEPYLLSSLDTKIQAKLQMHMPLEREWQSLYKLYTELYTLITVWQHMYKPHETHGLMFTYFLGRKVEHMEALMRELSKRSRLFDMDPFYAELEQLLRTLLLELDGYDIERFSLYRYYWLHVNREKGARERELASLQSITLYNTTFAEQLFAVLLKQEHAILALHTIDMKHCGYYIAIAKSASSLELTTASNHLLKLVLQKLQPYIQHTVAATMRTTFIEQIVMLYNTVPLSDDEERLLYESLGPQGLQFYSRYLLSKNRYNDWVALQMLSPTSLSHIELFGLKDVLEHDPALVLPLYHLYAMQEVEQKSRMNYKQAVRIWKMMKSAAKKSNKLTYFERYIESMQQRFKRLRALQEEIEKGKLLA